MPEDIPAQNVMTGTQMGPKTKAEINRKSNLNRPAYRSGIAVDDPRFAPMGRHRLDRPNDSLNLMFFFKTGTVVRAEFQNLPPSADVAVTGRMAGTGGRAQGPEMGEVELEGGSGSAGAAPGPEARPVSENLDTHFTFQLLMEGQALPDLGSGRMVRAETAIIVVPISEDIKVRALHLLEQGYITDEARGGLRAGGRLWNEQHRKILAQWNSQFLALPSVPNWVTSARTVGPNPKSGNAWPSIKSWKFIPPDVLRGRPIPIFIENARVRVRAAGHLNRKAQGSSGKKPRQLLQSSFGEMGQLMGHLRESGHPRRVVFDERSVGEMVMVRKKGPVQLRLPDSESDQHYAI
ncbi:hypothetical protein GGX14DRAFT_395680 [Mycena pura]|uniref:Uncharacterized protein n=1 Tax=Mycena pura TaxID=153505 RepID=A0AAD6VCW3_9AGAR|nr:hypothetical protein GGX14DRAFT_395680 [Mycena pura]